MVIYEKTERIIRIPRGVMREYMRNKQTCPEYEKGYDAGYEAGYAAARAQTVNLTQAEYDALEEKDCNIYYNIVDE